MEPHSVTRHLAELINASTTPWLGTRDHDHMGTVGCFQFFFHKHPEINEQTLLERLKHLGAMWRLRNGASFGD